MQRMRKILSAIFLLFIIFVSLLFSNIYGTENVVEGLENDTTLPSGLQIPGIDQQDSPVSSPSPGGHIEELEDLTDSLNETNDETDKLSDVKDETNTDTDKLSDVKDETNADTTTQENFQTKLVGSQINSENEQIPPILKYSLRTKPETNGIFDHIFGFSKQQTFHIKHP